MRQSDKDSEKRIATHKAQDTAARAGNSEFNASL